MILVVILGKGIVGPRPSLWGFSQLCLWRRLVSSANLIMERYLEKREEQRVCEIKKVRNSRTRSLCVHASLGCEGLSQLTLSPALKEKNQGNRG